MNIILKIFQFIGSLSILLYGMDLMSSGIQKGAGEGLQKLLKKITGNRFTAVLTGMSVTAIIQSSGATTVMVVGFVNAGLLTLTQAVGVIFGANIGTTITAWIVSCLGFSFDIAVFSIPIFGIGFIFKYFKKLKIRYYSDCFIGFGLLFLGLGFLKECLSLKPESVEFLQIFTTWGYGGIIIGVIIGALITALIHSSSAMTAIVLTMASKGSLTWELSVAIVLGSNIGSTVDAIMSAFGGTRNAKRTALVHFGFNVLGSVIALIFFKPFLQFIDLLVPGEIASMNNITLHIAMLHTIFNISATIIFLPFIDLIVKLANFIIKDTDESNDIHYQAPFVSGPKLNYGVEFYIPQIQNEVKKMAYRIQKMINEIAECVSDAKYNVESAKQNLENSEMYIDEMNEQLTGFIIECSLLSTANDKDRTFLGKQQHIIEGLDILSDECNSMMIAVEKVITKRNNKKSDSIEKLASYISEVKDIYDYCLSLIINKRSSSERQEILYEQKLDLLKKQFKKETISRIESGENVKSGLRYLDVVRKVDKTGDCIIEVMRLL